MATSDVRVAHQSLAADTDASQQETPLLGHLPDHDEPPSVVDQGTALHGKRALSTTVLYFMTIHFLFAFSEMILPAPLIRLFENSLCLSHYNFPVGGVEESLCKIHEIQAPLAKIRGWKSLFDIIPGSFR